RMAREEDDQFVGLFVKNLENVQGDERDVVILSICYGPGPDGRMLMNFGPINRRGGAKALDRALPRRHAPRAVGRPPPAPGAPRGPPPPPPRPPPAGTRGQAGSPAEASAAAT